MATSPETDPLAVLAPSPEIRAESRLWAQVEPWHSLGKQGRLIWGLPREVRSYTTWVNLDDLAYGCGCSDPTPCRHVLGLLELIGRSSAAFTGTTPPPALAALLGSTSQQQAAEESARKREQQDKRLQKRLENMRAGLLELETWLEDAMRLGLAHFQSSDREALPNLAARLVDAQASGAATQVREIAGFLRRTDWQDEVLDRVGRLHLLAQAFLQEAELDPALRESVRIQTGVSVRKETLLAEPGLADTWLVLGKRREKQERLEAQRTWLWGKTAGRFATIVEYAFGGRDFDTNLLPGTQLPMELAYYPGAEPLRAIVKVPPTGFEWLSEVPGHADLEAALQHYAEALGRLPMLPPYPLVVENCSAFRTRNTWRWRDQAGCEVPLDPGFDYRWELAAAGGGAPGTLFGEWSGHHLYPLGWGQHGRWATWEGWA